MAERMVPASGPMVFVSFGLSRGLSLDELCQAAGYEPRQLSDPTRMVPFEVSLRLWRTLIARLPGENVGLGIGLYGRLEHFGAFWQFLRYLANGLEAMEAYARFSPVGDTSCIENPIQVVHVGERVEVRWPPSLKYGIPERVETLNVAMLRLLRELGDPSLRPVAVRAAHAADEKRRLVEPYYGCAVTWNSADDALVFEREVLLRPFPGAQPEAARALRTLMEQNIAADDRVSLDERVRRALEIQLLRGDGSQRSVARLLGLSVRSLQRALQQQGLRFGDLFGQVLLRVAAERMRDPARSLDEIALELGYSETSSFARSWKRLTGESPARFRARLERSDSEWARADAKQCEAEADGSGSTALEA